MSRPSWRVAQLVVSVATLSTHLTIRYPQSCTGNGDCIPPFSRILPEKLLKDFRETNTRIRKFKMDESAMYNDSKNPLLSLTGDANSGVSPLEQEVLDEYERLLRNMNEVSDKISGLVHLSSRRPGHHYRSEAHSTPRPMPLYFYVPRFLVQAFLATQGCNHSLLSDWD